MTKYYIMEILQTQAFDVIMAVVFGMVMYYLLKWYISLCVKRLLARMHRMEAKMDLFLEIMNINLNDQQYDEPELVAEMTDAVD